MRPAQHPEPELALRQDRTDRDRAQLLRRDQQDRGIAIRTFSTASCRSGNESIPFTVTAEAMPARASPCT